MPSTMTGVCYGLLPCDRALQLTLRFSFQLRLTPGAQHYTHLEDSAQCFSPAAPMRCTGHGEELADE